jgi:hypothetical protein
MRKELDQRIVERWPAWFRVDGDVRETLMPLGFAHGDGWFELLWRLCERLEPVVAAAERESGHTFEVLQVKEKFGGLRFYTNFSDDAIFALIETAELESAQTCEVCGKPGARQSKGWITTRCDEHAGDAIVEPPDDEDDEIDFSDIPQWTPAQWSRAARGEAARKILRARVEADRPVWDAFWAAVRPVTQTDAFTRWFAGSKAVTDTEKPEVLFHATASSSKDFYCGQGPVGMEYGEDFGTGYYFFSSADTALTYGGPPSQDTTEHTVRIVPVYLCAVNPLFLRTGEDLKALWAGAGGKVAWFARTAGEKAAHILGLGFDSVLACRYAQWVVYQPAQIKAAIDDFTTSDSDMTALLNYYITDSRR